MYTFTNCISKTNNTQIDNAEDFVKPMSKLLECNNNNYAKASAIFWKYGRDEPDDDDITDSESFE